jgi:endonuclease YncB( thermonuclease family)
MGNLLQFGRRRRRSFAAPWLPVAIIAGALGISSLFFDGPLSGANVFSGSPAFHLCGHGPRQNCVIDGDTIWYQGVKIRLMDIDAPEVSEPKCASEAALGHKATLRLLELMNAGPFEVVRLGGRDHDKYGRKLRLIKRDGRPITDALIAEGLARRWDGRRRSWC